MGTPTIRLPYIRVFTLRRLPLSHGRSDSPPDSFTTLGAVLPVGVLPDSCHESGVLTHLCHESGVLGRYGLWVW